MVERCLFGRDGIYEVVVLKRRLLNVTYNYVMNLWQTKRFLNFVISIGISQLDATLKSFQKIASCYDALICGSDQVWVFELPTPYFLDMGNEYSDYVLAIACRS